MHDLTMFPFTNESDLWMAMYRISKASLRLKFIIAFIITSKIN